ncbi:unnamed protein product, partial [Closterium sp. Naga37s-1]
FPHSRSFRPPHPRLHPSSLRLPAPPCSCNFHVLGATGNVYTVTISQQPSCTCPDYGNGNLCKHVLFVLLRVLHVGRGGSARVAALVALYRAKRASG